MSLVLDSSAALAWIYPDETTEAIRRVFDAVADEGCVVPAPWRLEVANGLTFGLRRGRITAAFRTDALNVLDMLPISIDPETGAHAWSTTLQVADRFGLTLYEASYVELAQRHSLELATLDIKMRDAAHALGLDVIGG
ncbi:MAG TPA: type II toxin-antitoxin system VapC family toxin [Stellaceae bacterium]|nr:type II toxin-antitoxin system VapC family toxin [Stellaceae bacterium]